MIQKYEKLLALLKELFQLNQPDLDFGMYRVMHARSEEIARFLERDLLTQVKAAFGQYQSAVKAEAESNLKEAIAEARRHTAQPENSDLVKEARAKLEAVVDVSESENDVYDHLYSFFRRYYTQGDFLAKRVYKEGVYAIPYEGEEVTLHWANMDQYYVKTSEYLQRYAFCLRRGSEESPMRVHFHLTDATESEHGNVKTTEGKNRVFVLVAEGESGRDFVEEIKGEQGTELVIRFEYRPSTLDDWPDDERDEKKKPPKQQDLISHATQRILATDDPALSEWIGALGAAHTKANGDLADYSTLEAHLKRYSARNTFDYFIHKDLDAFLRRELDFYIKNEVVRLDDIENESAPRVEQYLAKIKVIRKIASKIIDFLAQIENFQKKLWLKKKFVIGTEYCIALGCIPEQFYPEILASEEQREEWVELINDDEITGDKSYLDISRNLTPQFIEANPTLMLDTQNFDPAFTSRLIDAMGDIDDLCDGVLFHSENFQALSAMKARYRDQLHYAYLDPPFNTTDVGFVYKNDYRHSSWLAMIAQTLVHADSLLQEQGLISVAIDDEEVFNLGSALDEIVLGKRRIGVLVVEIKPSGRTNDNFLSTSHEYYLWYAKNLEQADISFFDLAEGAAAAYSETDSNGDFKWRDFLRTGGYSTPIERPNSFYRIYFRESDGYIGTESVEGATEILPIDSSGEQRVWRKTPPSFLKHVEAGDIRVEKGQGGTMKVRIKDRIKDGVRPKSVWIGARYDAASHGTKLLQSILGKNVRFSYPKSLNAVFDAIWVATKDTSGACVLDYFAGSGTTGHAVIRLNREDGGKRKFILVEMDHYFDTVLLPRIKKVTFAPEWKNNKPKRLATQEEAQRSPRIIKVVRLESYEDTLNNLEIRRTGAQQSLLESLSDQGVDGFNETYFLRYMLDVETRGSQSLLNVQAFEDPTAYKLTVKRPGSDESREVYVDLIETFNWLIGLTVRRMTAPQMITAEFERDGEKRLQLKGHLKQQEDSPYWFRVVTGSLPDGRNALIVWRKLTGNMERDNLVLDAWFVEQSYFDEGNEFDVIFVNGSNNLENRKSTKEQWKVRLIEDDFHRLMFEIEGA